jgi:hypothetical protein
MLRNQRGKVDKLFVVIKMKKDLIIFLGINLATGLIVNYKLHVG